MVILQYCSDKQESVRKCDGKLYWNTILLQQDGGAMIKGIHHVSMKCNKIQELGFALNAVPKMKVDTAANAA